MIVIPVELRASHWVGFLIECDVDVTTKTLAESGFTGQQGEPIVS